MKLLDGRAIADQIQGEIQQSVGQLNGRKPCLTVVLVGEHPASKVYVKRKVQACEKVGIESRKIDLPTTISQEELFAQIDKLNQDPTVDGILVQLPLPDHIDEEAITLSINPDKDVDGFHPVNVGKMLIGQSDGFLPCTPHGVMVMLARSGIEVQGKHAVIIGRSNIVGKPMAALLMQNMPEANATVTVVHSRTQNLPEITRQADILVVAIGRPKFLKADMVKDGAVVVDVGINKVEGKLVGDVDFEEVKEKCSWITPVPGGVGPMTIAMLLSNTLKSYQRRS